MCAAVLRARADGDVHRWLYLPNDLRPDADGATIPDCDAISDGDRRARSHSLHEHRTRL
jgi:hypothetical protein